MPSRLRRLTAILLTTVTALGGCLPKRPVPQPYSDAVTATAATAALTQIEYPDVEAPANLDAITAEPPRSIRNLDDVKYWDISLEEVVRLALMNSKVLRDLGGVVLRSPDTTATSFDPAIQESDPRFGVEGALSLFDAQLKSNLTGENIDRRLNNRFLGNLGFLRGDRGDWNTEISKYSATGTQFAVRQRVFHERDNNPGNEFPNGAWTAIYEGEARQPLMRGGGLNFNRIAGPGAIPGVFNGVLIARIRTDVSLADFEIGLRDFVSNVENSYWDLYFSYRDLDARVKARDSALESWRRIQALYEAGRRGGEAEREAQAREQYFRFEAELQDSLAGRPLDGTRTNNGSRPGTFRAIAGVLVNERRLRLLMNIPANGDALIRPSDEPVTAPVVFDWPQISAEAIARRAELRRQRWQVKRREMELLASRNFLMPRLDAVGTYRFRGFGDNLIDSRDTGLPDFHNAYDDLTSGHFQEWNAGVEMSMFIGGRMASAGIHNAEVRLSRERILLEAQEREVINDLSMAVAEMDRAYVVMQTNYNRWVAARQQLAAVEAAFQDDRVEFISVLDAQRRYAEAESQNYRSRVEYSVAIRNVNFEKGTLLDFYSIILSEGPWPGKAYDDAARREATRLWSQQHRAPTPVVSAGPAPTSVRLPPIDLEPLPEEPLPPEQPPLP